MLAIVFFLYFVNTNIKETNQCRKQLEKRTYSSTSMNLSMCWNLRLLDQKGACPRNSYLRVLSFSDNLELQEDPRNMITFILLEPKLVNGQSLLPVLVIFLTTQMEFNPITFALSHRELSTKTQTIAPTQKSNANKLYNLWLTPTSETMICCRTMPQRDTLCAAELSQCNNSWLKPWS